jgi:hypothetical protein
MSAEDRQGPIRYDGPREERVAVGRQLQASHLLRQTSHRSTIIDTHAHAHTHASRAAAAATPATYCYCSITLLLLQRILTTKPLLFCWTQMLDSEFRYRIAQLLLRRRHCFNASGGLDTSYS